MGLLHNMQQSLFFIRLEIKKTIIHKLFVE